MDIGSRARAVGDHGRTVISAGRRGEGEVPSRRPPALPVSVSCRRSRLPGCRLQLLQFADSVRVPRLTLLPVPLGQPRPVSEVMTGLAAASTGRARTVADRHGATRPATTMTSSSTRAPDARLAEHGCLATVPADDDATVRKLTGLPGQPDVEVPAEDAGLDAGHYADSNLAEVAAVIARLLAAGRSPVQAPTSDAVIAARQIVEIKRLCTARVTAALFAYAPVFAGRPGGRDAAPAAGVREAGRG